MKLSDHAFATRVLGQCLLRESELLSGAERTLIRTLAAAQLSAADQIEEEVQRRRRADLNAVAVMMM